MMRHSCQLGTWKIRLLVLLLGLFHSAVDDNAYKTPCVLYSKNELTTVIGYIFYTNMISILGFFFSNMCHRGKWREKNHIHLLKTLT